MSSSYNNFINKINNKNTRNIKFVHIRADRQCRECNNTIKAGTLTLTINKQGQGRTWVCKSCIENKLNEASTCMQCNQTNVHINKETFKGRNVRLCDRCKALLDRVKYTESYKNSLAFGDDGGDMACDDALIEDWGALDKVNESGILQSIEEEIEAEQEERLRLLGY